MDCRNLERSELVEKYLNGQLDSTAQDEFEVHLLECPRCLQLVDTLQTVRFDLADRAAEIRTRTTHQRSWFKLQWAMAACMIVIVGGLGLEQVRKVRLKHQEVSAAHAQPQVAAGQNSANPPSTMPQVASGSTLPTDSVPKKGRDYLRSTLHDFQLTRNTLPSTGKVAQVHRHAKANASNPSPSATAAADVLAGMQYPSSPLPPLRPDANDIANSVPPSAQQKTSSDLEKIAAAAPIVKKTGASSLLSDDGEKELFRLGTVQPAPYTFSGFGSSVHLSPSLSPSGAKPGHVKSQDERRPLFKQAMLAYVDRRYDEASELLERAVSEQPNAADANFYLGVCDLLRGRPEQSLPPLQVAAFDDRIPLAQSAHFYLAKAYLQTRDFGSAEKELQAAAALTGTLTATAKADLNSLQTLRSKEHK